MTEVLFGVSVAFVGYVIFVLVDEQLKISPQSNHPSTALPIANIKTATPKPELAKPKTATATVKNKGADVSKMVNSTAGGISKYLKKNGSTSVAKLLREFPDDAKMIQRSIGWLAREDKISLDVIDRAETVSLKD